MTEKKPAELIQVSGNTLTFQGKTYRCAIGKNGFSADKKEGDGCTPIGTFALRECWYRPDRLSAPQTLLPLKIITQQDGWCDDPESAEYNRHIATPFPFSHETLWRDDHAYDLIIPLGYNDNPPAPGKGSAIFMHLAQPDWRGTEGCVALAQKDLLEILQHLSITTSIQIA